MEQQALIYIIGNNDSRVESIAAQLSEDGLTLEVHCDAADALAHAVMFPPAAIVIDFVHDPAWAFKLCDGVRSHQVLNPVPVIAITDVEDCQMMKDVFDMGADELLLEPYASCELLARLLHLLEKNISLTR